MTMYPYKHLFDKVVTVAGLGDYTSLVTAAASDILGDSTTQFDITNPAGSTARYTYDGTGTDPVITALTVQLYKRINIDSQNFNAANNDLFYVTGSGANYFEVTNAAVVPEVNVTIGTGVINLCSSFLTYGELTETLDFEPLSGQKFTHNDTVLDFATGKGLIMYEKTGVQMKGRLQINSDGIIAYDYAIALLYGYMNCNLGQCQIIANPDYSAVGANDVKMFWLAGYRSFFNLYGRDIDIDVTLGANTAAAIHCTTLENCKVEATMRDITGAAPSILLGLMTEAGADKNRFDICFQNINTTTGNLGEGAEFVAGANRNEVHGVIYSTDSGTELTDGGTNNNTTGLVIT